MDRHAAHNNRAVPTCRAVRCGHESAVTFDVTYDERRSRLTTAFRYLLAIPHLIFVGLWGYAAEFVALLQWFVILFTGQRNEGMWNFQRGYLGYNAARVVVRRPALRRVPELR